MLYEKRLDIPQKKKKKSLDSSVTVLSRSREFPPHYTFFYFAADNRKRESRYLLGITGGNGKPARN